MASTYYNSVGKSVNDGDVAFAADLNDINLAVDTAFQQVEAAMNTLSTNVTSNTELARKWAEELENVQVTAGKYSAFHHAQKAAASATSASTSVTTAAGHASNASTQATNAANSAANAATSATQASGFATNAGSHAAAASTSATNAANSATSASNSAAAAAASIGNFPVLQSGDEGKFLVVNNPYTAGYKVSTVDASSGGGLKWEVSTTNKTALKDKGYLMDTTSGTLTVTLPASPTAGDSVGIADLQGTFGTNSCTVDPNGLKIHGSTETMLLDVKNQRCVLSYSGATSGWIIVDLVPSGSQWEYMPYAQAVARTTTSPTIGSTGWTDIPFTSLPGNDIAGASLSAGSVILPAGEYTFDSFGPKFNPAGLDYIAIRKLDGSVVVTGSIGDGQHSSVLHSEKITFTTETTLKLSIYSSSTVSAQPNASSLSYHASLKITKIGGNYAPKPVISAARLQPMAGVVPNCQVQGFEITNTGANQLTVTKGQCLDSGLTTPIAVTGNTVLTLDATANKLFSIAAVILNDGTHTCKAYDSEAAMAADVGVNATHVAYIGWWQNNGSGAAKVGRLFGVGDGLAELWWAKASENALFSKVTCPANCNTSVNLAAYLPSSDRVAGVMFGVQGATATGPVMVGWDGTNACCALNSQNGYLSDNDVNTWGHSGSDRQFVPSRNNTVYWGCGTTLLGGTHQLLIGATRFRR